MAVAADVTRSAQEQIIESVQLGQKAVLEGARAWSEAFEKMIPELPSASFYSEFPTYEEAVDNAFDFAGKLLDGQRQFAKSLFSATAPVRPKADKVRGEAERSVPKRPTK